MTPGISADHPEAAAAGNRRIEELQRELDEELRERIDAGVCGCGCGAPLPSRKGGRKYARESHRQRAHRHRLELIAKALAIPARLSLRELRQYEPTGERHADAQEPPQAPKRRRSAPRPGVTLYLPSVEVAERLALGLHADGCTGEGRASRDVLLAAIERALERRRRRETPPAAA